MPAHLQSRQNLQTAELCPRPSTTCEIPHTTTSKPKPLHLLPHNTRRQLIAACKAPARLNQRQPWGLNSRDPMSDRSTSATSLKICRDRHSDRAGPCSKIRRHPRKRVNSFTRKVSDGSRTPHPGRRALRLAHGQIAAKLNPGLTEATRTRISPTHRAGEDAPPPPQKPISGRRPSPQTLASSQP